VSSPGFVFDLRWLSDDDFGTALVKLDLAGVAVETVDAVFSVQSHFFNEPLFGFVGMTRYCEAALRRSIRRERSWRETGGQIPSLPGGRSGPS